MCVCVGGGWQDDMQDAGEGFKIMYDLIYSTVIAIVLSR